MDSKVRAHSGGNKVIPGVGADKADLFLTVKLHGQGYFSFTGKLGLTGFLALLNTVPEDGAVLKFRWGMGEQ